MASLPAVLMAAAVGRRLSGGESRRDAGREGRSPIEPEDVSRSAVHLPADDIVFYDGSKHSKCTVDLTVHEIALTVDSVFEEVNSGTP